MDYGPIVDRNVLFLCCCQYNSITQQGRSLVYCSGRSCLMSAIFQSGWACVCIISTNNHNDNIPQYISRYIGQAIIQTI